MGISGPTPGFKKRSRRRSFALASEINVTPFVDVMLVLLIIFMITAPLMTTGIQIDLPKAKTQSLNEAIEPLTITVDKEGTIFIQEAAIPLEALTEKLHILTQNNPEARLYVRGDTALSYGEIMTVMAHIGNAGYTKVALLTDIPRPSTESSTGSRKAASSVTAR